MTGLKSGWKTSLLNVQPGVDTSVIEGMINERLSKIQDDAYSAGFHVDIKSVNTSNVDGKEVVVILYKLKNDYSFFPPM